MGCEERQAAKLYTSLHRSDDEASPRVQSDVNRNAQGYDAWDNPHLDYELYQYLLRDGV